MGRPPRLLAPDSICHVMARGNNRRVIFDHAAAREIFIALLDRVSRQHRWKGFAYCLMGNHVHLLVQTPLPNLDAGMRDLLGRYARHHNRRTGRHGHLFGDRYRSRLVADDSYLLTVLRYIARNPVEAGLVERPEQWESGSYAHLVNGSPPPAFIDVDATLGLFHHRRWAALHQLRRFVSLDDFDARRDPDGVPDPPCAVPSAVTVAAAVGDREAMRYLHARGDDLRTIGAAINIAPSTVLRRLRREGPSAPRNSR